MKFFQNIKYEKEKPGMSKVMWAPVDAIAIFPTLPLPGTGTLAGDTLIAIGDFIFKDPLAGFINLFNDLYKGSELDWKSDGDLSSPDTIAQVKGRVNGMNAEILELYRDVLGVPGIALIKDSKCSNDEWWVVGCDCNPAQFIIDGKSATKGSSDAKGVLFEIKSYQVPYKYISNIEIIEGLQYELTIEL